MTTADLKAFLLRALARKSPATEASLIDGAKNVFLDECRTSDVTAALRALDDGGFITTEHSDGITPTTCALTLKGQHKAKML